MSPKTFSIAFWIVALTHIFGELCAYIDPEAQALVYLRYATKPLLMPLLIGYFISLIPGKKSSLHYFIIGGFVFSWFGDISLMFQTKINFLIGLGSFLTTHVLYMLAFTKDFNNTPDSTILKRKPYLAIPLLFSLGVLLFILIPSLGKMTIPVVIYASVITLMVLMALNRHDKVTTVSFQLVLWGALIFMVSDTMIALNKFYRPFVGSRVAIMFTYLTAQYLIARGTFKTTS